MKTFWGTIFFFLLSLGFAVQAQTIQDASRPWSKGALTWADFMGKPMSDSLFTIAWRFNSEDVTQKIDGVRYTYTNFEGQIDCTSSWYRPEMRNAQSLRYCQLLFDLVELYARKTTAEWARQSEHSYSDIYSFYENQLKNRLAEVKESTNSGADKANLDLCLTSVAHELAESEFHPEQVHYTDPSFGGDFYIGLLMNSTQSDYIKGNTWSFNIGWVFAKNKHRYIWDLAMGGGSKAGKDYLTDGYDVYKGEKIGGGQISLGYGYCVSEKNDRLLVPFASFGVHFYNADPIEVYGKNNKEARQVSGPILSLGCYYDIPFSRHYTTSRFASFSNQKCSIHAIRIKPYVGMSHLSEYGGWTPSLNLSVTYSFSSRIYNFKKLFWLW